MTDRASLSHGVMAAAACGLALVSWLQPKLGAENPRDEVVMMPGSAADLTEVRWHEERYDVVVTRRDGGDLQVVVTQRAAKPPPDSNRTAPAPSVKMFPGSKQAQELWEKLAPLNAARSLGVPDATALQAMGFADANETLTLRLNGRDRLIAIGNATYGTADRYAREGNGEVFLLKAATLSGLRHGAAALLEKSVVALERTQIERVTVRADGTTREFVQRHREDPKAAFFADPAAPDNKLETATQWLDRVVRLRIQDTTTSEPSGTPRLQITVQGVGKNTTLELWDVQDDAALARAPHFGGYVTISKANAEAIVRDIEAVLQEGR